MIDYPKYVDLDNHFDDIVSFLQKNFHKYPPAKKIRSNDWGSFKELMSSKKLDIAPSFGKCFHSAKFCIFFGGGKRYYDLMLLKPFVFSSEIDIKTTHWFLKRKCDGKIFDPTADQFIYDIDINDLYPHAKRGEFGNPYWGRNRNGKKYSPDVVPNATVLMLAELYKKEHGTIGSIDWWLEEKDREDKKMIKESNLERFIN